MLIGLDASRAFVPNPTGTERYSREIILRLIRDRAHTYRLYTREKIAREALPDAWGADVRAMPFPRLWTHARLSVEMLLHPSDALFVPAHVIPLIHPRHSYVTIHDLGYLHFPEAHPLLSRLYLDLATRWNAQVATRIIADSNATRADLANFYHVNPAKIRVVYPAPDTQLFHPAPSEAIARVKEKYRLADDYLLSVGTLHPRKNYVRLIRAFTALPPKYQLVVVGRKGWLFDEIFGTVQELGLGECVKFLDYVAAEELPALYSGARVFVFPSLHEGFGFPILEAQLCETPVVCSNTSSLPEVAGDAAEFFDPREVEAMSSALTRALNDDARRAELVARGQENARRFSWDRAAREILEAIVSI
jgi:glycosyltransferase involved in cell wall biosynthesis